jgi:hypothetical protein
LSGLPRRESEHFDAILPGQGNDLLHIGPPLPEQFICLFGRGMVAYLACVLEGE